MARYKDLNDKFSNVKWDGVDPDVINFRNELYDTFPHMRVTSALRTGNGVGKAGNKSRHNQGQALDLAIDDQLHKFFYSSAGDALLRKHNLGFLDESLEETRKHTGATGPHFHIGKDSTLSGNSNKYNKAFKVETSVSQPTTDDGHNHDSEEPSQNLIHAPNTPGTSPEFFQKIYEEASAREAELAVQFEEEKASAARQNAIQQRVKEKMDHQESMMELIKGHDLEPTSRAKSFADGGEFEGLNENLNYKMRMIKAQMPDFTQVNPEESETFKELTQTRARLQEIAKAGLSAMNQQAQPVPVQGEETIEEPAMDSNAKKSLENTSVANKLYNRLSTLGLENHQIAGVIGSLSGESGVNLSATARNPTSGAFGIAQWLGSRLTGLKAFGKERGRDFKNEDIQIEYLLHELQNTPEKKSLQAIKSAKTTQEATMIWTRQFERPSEKEIQKSIAQRVKNAQMFQNQFS